MRSLIESILDKANKKDTTNSFNPFVPATPNARMYTGEDRMNAEKYLREVASKKGTRTGAGEINMWNIDTQNGEKLNAKTYGIYFNYGGFGLVCAVGKREDKVARELLRKGIEVEIQGNWYFTNLATYVEWHHSPWENKRNYRELYLIDEETWLDLFKKMGDAFGRESEADRCWRGDKKAQKIVKKLLKL